MSEIPEDKSASLKNADVFDEEGKLDILKFAKLMAKLHNISEKQAITETLNFLGIKYKDLANE